MLTPNAEEKPRSSCDSDARADFQLDLRTFALGAITTLIMKFGITGIAVIWLIFGLVPFASDHVHIQKDGVAPVLTAAIVIVSFMSLNILQVCLWSTKGFILNLKYRIVVFILMFLFFIFGTEKFIEIWKDDDAMMTTILLIYLGLAELKNWLRS